MDAIAFIRRLVKGSALTHAEGDANLDVTQTALEQLDAEKLSADDAEEITDTLATVDDDDEFVAYDTSAAGAAKTTTALAIRAPLVTRLDAIDDTIGDIETILAGL